MILEFKRYQEFHNPSINQMRKFARDNGWKNFTTHWDRWLKDSVVVMERLSTGQKL